MELEFVVVWFKFGKLERNTVVGIIQGNYTACTGETLSKERGNGQERMEKGKEHNVWENGFYPLKQRVTKYNRVTWKKKWPSKWFRFWFGESQPWVTNEGDTSLILPEGSLACTPALGKAGRQIHVKSGLRVPREDLSPFWTFKESLCPQFSYHEVQRWLTHWFWGLLQDMVSPIRRAVSPQEPRGKREDMFPWHERRGRVHGAREEKAPLLLVSFLSDLRVRVSVKDPEGCSECSHVTEPQKVSPEG